MFVTYIVGSKDLSAQVGGKKDVAADRGEAALGVFFKSKVNNQADEAQRVTTHKDLTWQ